MKKEFTADPSTFEVYHPIKGLDIKVFEEDDLSHFKIPGGKMQAFRVKANQIELQIRDYAQEAEAIIFLHFSGANLMMWQLAIPYFQDHYRLILVDLRGHGKSDKPESGYHMDDMAHDVIEVMDFLALEQTHIVGSSLGAEVGLSLAANYPERIISLVCEGAPISEFGSYGTWEGSETAYKEHVARQLERIRNQTETVYPSVDALVTARRELLTKYGLWNEHIEAVERYGACQVDGEKVIRSFGKQAMAAYMCHYFQYRFEGYYQKVHCPLLMLAETDSDDEREKIVLKELRGLADQGQIIEVSDWIHPYGWLLDPENISRIILQFLSGLAQ